jgi:hypothetical protein
LPKLPQASKFEKKTLHANQKIKKERSWRNLLFKYFGPYDETIGIFALITHNWRTHFFAISQQVHQMYHA